TRTLDFAQPSFFLSIIVLSSSFETEEGTVYENHPRTAAADAVYDYDPPRKEAQAVCRERSRRFQAQKGKLARKTLENGPFRPVDLPVFWNMAGSATHEDSPKRSITPYHQPKAPQGGNAAHDECPELDREGCEGAVFPAEAADVTNGDSFTWGFLVVWERASVPSSLVVVVPVPLLLYAAYRERPLRAPSGP
ncbi:hypothetical protein FOZ63_002058, partial [Perkinsus olseni]